MTGIAILCIAMLLTTLKSLKKAKLCDAIRQVTPNGLRSAAQKIKELV